MSSGSIERQRGSHSLTLLVSSASRIPRSSRTVLEVVDQLVVGAEVREVVLGEVLERDAAADLGLEPVAEEVEELRLGHLAALEVEERVLAVGLGRADHRVPERLHRQALGLHTLANPPNSGVVSTPPKSEMIASDQPAARRTMS